MQLSKMQIRFLIISNISCWALLAILLLGGFTTQSKDAKFDVITAERINIVNEDGTTVIAISNKERVAAPRMDGKEYPVNMIERQHLAGMIFFNEAGDEMGGLLFNSAVHSSGKSYGLGHLSFDRHRDNQVINLEYKENIHGTVKSGITFYDRKGDGSFGKSLDMMKEYYYDEVSAERKKELENKMRQMRKAGDYGAERVFLGSHNQIPQLTLKDQSGKDRIKIFVDSTNIAKIHFLDESGAVMQEFPERK